MNEIYSDDWKFMGKVMMMREDAIRDASDGKASWDEARRWNHIFEKMWCEGIVSKEDMDWMEQRNVIRK